jgi:hypothetical protein
MHVIVLGMTSAPKHDPTPREADGGPPETDADRAHYDRDN